MKYIFVTSPRTWKKLIQDTMSAWPIKARYANTIKKHIQKNDEIIIYVTGKSAVAGKIQVTDSLKTRSSALMYSGELYDATLPVKFISVLDDDKWIQLKQIASELELTSGRGNNWGAVFQRAMISITDNDFQLINVKIEFKV